MKRAIVFVALLFVLVLTACSSEPDPADIQAGVEAAIAQTEAASPADTATPEPAETPFPADTPLPTQTPAPMPTATPESCTAQAADFMAELDNILGVWDDVNALANSTPRISLAAQIAPLQEIKRQAADLDAPECASSTSEQLLLYMESVIDGYLAFVADENADAYFQAADFHLDLYLITLQGLAQQRQPDTLAHVRYWVGGYGDRNRFDLDPDKGSISTIFYWDENQDEIQLVDEPLPWSYEFYVEPGSFLSISASYYADVCVILVNGKVATLYDADGQTTCRARP